MTVIAWDGQTLAADRRCSSGTSISWKQSKIFKINNHLAGACGEVGSCAMLLEWFRSGADAEKYPECQNGDDAGELLVITPDKKVLFYGSQPKPTRIRSKAVALGSGADCARVALYMGATATEAVRMASRVKACCGDGVDTLTLEDK